MAINDAKILKRVGSFAAATGKITYKGISVAPSIKLNYHTFLRTWRGALSAGKPQLGYFFQTLFRKFIVFTYRGLRGVLWRGQIYRNRKELIALPKHKIVVVSDASGRAAGYLSDVLVEFDKNDVVIVETFRPGNDDPWSDYPNYINLSRLLISYRPAKLHLYYRCYRKIMALFQGLRPDERIFMFSEVCLSLQAIDCFEFCFDILQPSAVLTLDSTHLNNYVASHYGLRQKAVTCVCQHGDPTVLFDLVPVHSQILFVWGEKSKLRYTEGNVPLEKIVIAGNPHLDRVFSHYLPNRAELRNQIVARYHLNGHRKTITYLSSGTHVSGDLTPRESETLLNCVCAVASLPINIVIKLHPTADDPDFFRSWLQKNDLCERVTIVQSEDIRNILAATDIAAMYHTSAGIEAICFGIPTITLNVIPGLDVKESITYADDTIECTSRDGFFDTVKQLVANDEEFRRQEARTLDARRKHFPNSENFNSSKYIRNFMLSSIHQHGNNDRPDTFSLPGLDQIN